MAKWVPPGEAEVFGETTNANHRFELIKRIAWQPQAVAPLGSSVPAIPGEFRSHRTGRLA